MKGTFQLAMLRTRLTSVAKRQYLHTGSTNIFRPSMPSLLRVNTQPSHTTTPYLRSFSACSVIRSQVRPAEQKNGIVISDRAIQVSIVFVSCLALRKVED